MNKGICTKIRIGEKVQQWKAHRGYLKTSVTLMDVCEELSVNRTYMSNYINERYRTNFNTWINGLRVKDATRIIRQNPHLALGEVGRRVGYTDLAHFSKQFKLYMGASPSHWRKAEMEKRKKD